jgi:hypothetical protein
MGLTAPHCKKINLLWNVTKSSWTSIGRLWTLQWTFRCHKMVGYSWKLCSWWLALWYWALTLAQCAGGTVMYCSTVPSACFESWPIADVEIKQTKNCYKNVTKPLFCSGIWSSTCAAEEWDWLPVPDGATDWTFYVRVVIQSCTDGMWENA